MIDYANLLTEITNVPHTLQRSSNLSRARGFRDRSAADRPSMNHRSERRTFGQGREVSPTLHRYLVWPFTNNRSRSPTRGVRAVTS